MRWKFTLILPTVFALITFLIDPLLAWLFLGFEFSNTLDNLLRIISFFSYIIGYPALLIQLRFLEPLFGIPYDHWLYLVISLLLYAITGFLIDTLLKKASEIPSKTLF